jgi:hypothetical protein
VARHPGTPTEIAAHFDGAELADVTRHLETLELLGELEQDWEFRYRIAAGTLVAV